MKSYHPPEWEPTPIFEAWVAGTAGQVGLGAILAVVVVVALLLSLRWRGGSSGGSSVGAADDAEPDPAPRAREPYGGQRVKQS